MHVFSIVLAGAAAAAVQAGGIVGDGGIVVRRALAGGNATAVVVVAEEVPAWGAAGLRWEEAHAGDAGMLSAGQKLSTQTYAAEDRESMMHVEPTGHVAPPAEDAADAEASKQQQQHQPIPRGPDFSWMWSVDGALAVGMVVVTTGLVFTAAG